MNFVVQFTRAAQKDLREIHVFIAQNDSFENADLVARGIVKAALTLRDLPKRGLHPPELLLHGNRSYRQIFSNPTGFSIESVQTRFLSA